MPRLLRTPRPSDPVVGQAIRQYVADRTPGQAELARRLGMDRSALGRALLGRGTCQSEQLTPELVRRIAFLVEAPRPTEAEWLALLNSNEAMERTA